jgi:hypothetical protein
MLPARATTATPQRRHFSAAAAVRGADKGGSGFPWRRRRASPGGRWARLLWRLRGLLVGRRAVGAPARSMAAADQAVAEGQHSEGDSSSSSLAATLAAAAAAAAGKGKAKAGNELRLRCTEFDKMGRVTLVSGEFKKSELIAKVRLQPTIDRR